MIFSEGVYWFPVVLVTRKLLTTCTPSLYREFGASGSMVSGDFTVKVTPLELLLWFVS